MEIDLHILSSYLKITEENVWIENAGMVTINGIDREMGSGYHNIYRLYKGDLEISRLSFFSRNDTPVKEYEELKNIYLNTLCKFLTKPLNIFIEKLNSNVAVQA